jgi:hypothetical protein
MRAEGAQDREAGAVIFKPSLLLRLRRWCGFRFHLGDEPDGTDNLKWMRTDVCLAFGLMDRLRLLTTGRLKVSLTSHVSEDFRTVKNRMDWQIFAPGESWR